MVPVRLACAALVALVVVVPRSAPARHLDLGGVDEAVRDAIDAGEVPGAVVLVGRGDDVLLHRAWGWRRLVPSREAMTTDTIFDIASLTKPLGTTLAVMSLAERDRVRLDAPLGRYLREFRGPAWRGVTLRRLLTHTAGLRAVPPSELVAPGFPAAARALASLPLDYPPGRGFAYSDTGFILLGEVVRRVSGQPLDRYLAERFFEPLGLGDTGFRPPRESLDRVAPTQVLDGRPLRGEVHDPRARALGGVAGHAGMFSTASDLGRLVRALLAGGALDGRRVLKAETVRAMWQPMPDGEGKRALGWDVNSDYAMTMAPFFPPGSVGHTGFTGTAVWIDPPSRTYMILLTNRVHPWGGGAAGIRGLRMRIAAAVGTALFYRPLAEVAAGPAADPVGPARAETAGAAAAPPPGTGTGRVLTGLDRLVAQRFAPLAGESVALLTNQTGVDRRGRRAVDLLAAAPRVRLAAILAPEHGLSGGATAEVPHGRDAATGRPVWSLYGPTQRPTPAMLRGITRVVVDLQDVGVRYYTYLTTLVYVLEAAARHGIPVTVLDRPNPITGRAVEGPLLDPDLESFTGVHPVPVRTGLTIGEFARMAAAERGIPVHLTVVPLAGWSRGMWYDETGLPWVNPSPNIRSVTQALLYAGVGLIEGTNVSVGRGTDTPFEVVGAPWVDDPAALADSLSRLGLPGVRFAPARFTPTENKHRRTECGGVRLVVTDREAIRPVMVGLALARVLRERHRDQFRPESIQNLLVNRATMWALLHEDSLERLEAWTAIDRASFLNRRASYLIYR